MTSPGRRRGCSGSGSAVVRGFSTTSVPDVTSGFRAYSREAALQVQVVSKFTYALETIIQAGKMFVAIDSVPIATNPKTRDSRLFTSTWEYVRRNGLSILRVYTMYEPLRVFMIAALSPRSSAQRSGSDSSTTSRRATATATCSPSSSARRC